MKTCIKNLFTRLGGASCAAWVLPALIGMLIAIKIWHDLPVATRKYLVEAGYKRKTGFNSKPLCLGRPGGPAGSSAVS